MKWPVKALWIKELRSGRVNKARGRLKVGERLCVLGVLTDLYIKRHPDRMSWVCYGGFNNHFARTNDPAELSTCDLPTEVLKWSGLKSKNPFIKSIGMTLADLNDSGATLCEMADVIYFNL